MTASYLDPRTGQTWPLSTPLWCGPEGQPLMISPLPGITRAQIDTSQRSLWRYAAALPVAVENPVSMGEGCTPLIERRIGDGRALLKCEWFMPTGSFKDRGASVMLSILRQQGITAVLEDSSGNGGAAIAAYAAAAGMKARILAPDSTSPAKTVAMRAVGAEVGLVPGPRQATADEAVRQSHEIFYASHNWQPFFLQGTKTLAYEIWEDLGFRAPDNIIIPCGAGSNVLGCGIGFAELLRAGEIERMPRLFASQPANCSPIAAAFLADEETTSDISVLPTMAEGTAIAKPVRPREVLGFLRESEGGAVTVTEDEIAAAMFELARTGVYVEPTSAQAAAAYRKLLTAQAIEPEQTTVLVLTGSGLKATPRIADLLGITLQG